MTTYQNYFNLFEKGFYAACALGILVQSCVGGITAMAILENGNGLFQMIQLFFVVIACITFNGAIISVQKPKAIYNIFIGSMLLCGIIAIVNFFI